MSKTTWRQMLSKIMGPDETIDDLIAVSPNSNVLNIEFEEYAYGQVDEDDHFIAWTKDWIYSADQYDGQAQINCVRRNPPEHCILKGRL